MIKHYSIATTFGITAPVSMKVEGFEPAQNVYVPTQKPYVFRKDHLRDVLAFLGSPNGDGLYLTGPTGSGKTSLHCRAGADCTGFCGCKNRVPGGLRCGCQ